MWDNFLKVETNKQYYKEIINFLRKESAQIYPKEEDRFNAYKLSDFDMTKVLILGQDPYQTPGFAHGLAFSCLSEKRPKSLGNIYKELNDDLGIKIPLTNDLTCWAQQGILLLNTSLTVRKNEVNSHKNIGWNNLIVNTIKELQEKDYVVYVLWGIQAKQYKKYVTNPNHLVIESAHPSPLSARFGFFKSKPFSKINKYLEHNGLAKIDWAIE